MDTEGFFQASKAALMLLDFYLKILGKAKWFVCISFYQTSLFFQIPKENLIASLY